MPVNKNIRWETMLPDKKTAEDFKDIQYAFTRYIRNPENSPEPEGIESRRLAIYCDLIHRGIERFIAGNFPVLRKITDDDRWHSMVRDYISEHQAKTPLFPKMPLEFIQYLEHEYQKQPGDGEFLLELAAYEWSETAVSIDTREIDMSGIDTKGDLLAGIPVLNPIMIPHTCTYPVHKIGPDYIPDAPSEHPVYLIVYRRRDDKVKFLELNSVTARLIECMQKNIEKTGLRLLQRIAKELDHDPKTVINGGHEIMIEMRDKEVILGVQSA